MARLRKKPLPKGPLVERVLEDGTIIIGHIVATTPREPVATTIPDAFPSAGRGTARGRIVKRRLPDGDLIYGRIVSKK